jgi:hypothetical protein
MALDPRKRQKKAERRKAKERAKRKDLSRKHPSDKKARFAASATSPILHCCTITELYDEGIGHVLLSRSLSGGQVAFALFLIDMYCLGVKDAIYEIAPRGDYIERLYEKIFQKHNTARLEPACARKLVEGAVAYADDLGFSPHADYHKAKLIFGDIAASSCTRQFHHGNEGKPFFVAGPYDDRSRCVWILNTLFERCGPGGFDYLMPIDVSEFLSDELLAMEGEHMDVDELDELHLE